MGSPCHMECAQEAVTEMPEMTNQVTGRQGEVCAGGWGGRGQGGEDGR